METIKLPVGPQAIGLKEDERLQILQRLAAHFRERVHGPPKLKTGLKVLDEEYVRNEEVTAKLQKQEKFVRFNEWCAKYGVRAPSLEFPVAFGPTGDLVGVAAKKDINPNEAFVYVPVNLTLNEEQFRRGTLGEVYETNIQEWKEDVEYEHFVLTFFVAYQLSLGSKSFWHPYFEVAANVDLPLDWESTDLDFLEDEILRQQINDVEDEIRDEYEYSLEIAEQCKPFIRLESFTYDNFKRAFSMVKTRAFGYSVPYLMLVPFADMCNHHCVKTYFELYNHRLASKALNGHLAFDGFEKHYFTNQRSAINFSKHFEEDKTGPALLNVFDQLEFKKLAFRDRVLGMTPAEVVSGEHHVWEMNYMSTSDEEVADTEEEDESSSEDESDEDSAEEEKENTNAINKLFKKNVQGQGHNVPEFAKQFRRGKLNQPRTRFEPTVRAPGEQPKPSLVVQKLTDQRAPGDLIQLILKDKNQQWLKHQNLKFVKEEQAEWQAMVSEMERCNQSMNEEENYSWYELRDKETFFALYTRCNFTAGHQVFSCYGQRSNATLLENYGFCLQHNKYNSLRFDINIDFNWKENREQTAKTDDKKVKKHIFLKANRISDELLAYFRSNLIQEQQKKDQGKQGTNLLVGSPVDPHFEMLVVGCTITLLESLKESRFKTSITQDLEMLKMQNLN